MTRDVQTEQPVFKPEPDERIVEFTLVRPRVVRYNEGGTPFEFFVPPAVNQRYVVSAEAARQLTRTYEFVKVVYDVEAAPKPLVRMLRGREQV